MPNRLSIPLPDFRNLGVVLRAAVGVQALAFLASLVRTETLTAAVSDFVALAMVVQPPLLLTLLLLFLGAPWLTRFSHAQGMWPVMLVAAAASVLWRLALSASLNVQGGENLIRVGLLGAATAGAMLMYFNWRHRVLSPALSEARLQALQARIRPHFLFNSLNTVLGLIRDDPRQAESVLENLADLFRVLMADNRDLSPLKRELALARAYVEIEAMRLGNRLRLTWKVDETARRVLLPPLILQPLLENAIYHGVEPNPQGGDIRVDIFVLDQRLNIVVRNPVPSGPRTDPRPGNRMALSNISERLALHFDAEARLTTHTAGGEFFVQIVLPVKMQARPTTQKGGHQRAEDSDRR